MAYRAASVANEFLDLAGQENKNITQIEIQKLVYFAHGWNLAIKDEPLIGELIEAWPYGPVVRTLWDAFKKFGKHPITDRASIWEMDRGRLKCKTPSLLSDSPEDDIQAKAIVRSVWGKYGHLEPFKLVEITHLPESPWKRAIDEQKIYISDESIKVYFKSLMPTGQTE